MSTVKDLIDRLYRTYLYPPDYEPPMVQAIDDITASEVSFRLSDFQVTEDKELLRAGILLEWERELMRVTDFDGVDRVTVVRGQAGTGAVAHDAGTTFGILAPSFPRQSVFESVRDNIVSLFPTLFTVSNENLVSVNWNVAGVSDPLAVEVESIWPGHRVSTVELEGRIVDYHPAVDGRALITNLSVGDLWVRYRRRFGIATDETSTYEDIGFDDVWANIVMAGAAADLFVGRDIPAAAVEWITQAMQAEMVPVGERTSVAVTLGRYRDYLLDRFSKEMKGEYKPKVHMRSAFQRQSRSWVG